MSAERLTAGLGEEDLLYTWPTFMSGHRFLATCDEYKQRGFFGLEVEVIVFTASSERDFGEEVDYEEYLRRGSDFDAEASAVRFNARIPTDKFSVVWVPSRDRPVDADEDAYNVAVGELQAVFGHTPQFMISMISESITDAGRPYVKQLVAEGLELQPTLA